MNARAALAPLLGLSLLGGPAFAQKPPVQAGSFPEGERYVAPSAVAPPQVSRALVRTIVLREGRGVLELPVNDAGPLVVWSIAGSAPASADEGRADGALPGRVGITLRSPSGLGLREGKAAAQGAQVQRFALAEAVPGLDLPGAQESLYVSQPEPGLHRLELESAGEARAAVTVVMAQPESRLTLAAWSGPLSRQPDQAVTLHAALRDGDTPLTGARVTARLAPPQGRASAPARLFDDGRHGDGAAGDGIYAARVSVLPADAGLWTVRFEAQGHDARGLPFARTGSSGFVTEPGSARLVAGSVRARIVGDRLRVEGRAEVKQPGRYRVDVIVAGPADAEGSRPALFWAESTQRLASGRSVPFSVELTVGASEAGRGLLLDVRLLGMDTPTLVGRETIELTR